MVEIDRDDTVVVSKYMQHRCSQPQSRVWPSCLVSSCKCCLRPLGGLVASGAAILIVSTSSSQPQDHALSRHGRKLFGPSIGCNECCRERSTVEGKVATSTLSTGWLEAVFGGVRSSLEQARSPEPSSAHSKSVYGTVEKAERRCLEC